MRRSAGSRSTSRQRSAGPAKARAGGAGAAAEIERQPAPRPGQIARPRRRSSPGSRAAASAGSRRSSQAASKLTPPRGQRRRDQRRGVRPARQRLPGRPGRLRPPRRRRAGSSSSPASAAAKRRRVARRHQRRRPPPAPGRRSRRVAGDHRQPLRQRLGEGHAVALVLAARARRCRPPPARPGRPPPPRPARRARRGRAPRRPRPAPPRRPDRARPSRRSAPASAGPRSRSSAAISTSCRLRGISEPMLRISGGSPPPGARGPGAVPGGATVIRSGATPRPSASRRAVAALVQTIARTSAERRRLRRQQPRALRRVEPALVAERMMHQRHQPQPRRLGGELRRHRPEGRARRRSTSAPAGSAASAAAAAARSAASGDGQSPGERQVPHLPAARRQLRDQPAVVAVAAGRRVEVARDQRNAPRLTQIGLVPAARDVALVQRHPQPPQPPAVAEPRRCAPPRPAPRRCAGTAPRWW